jgi:hypothetical protein
MQPTLKQIITEVENRIVSEQFFIQLNKESKTEQENGHYITLGNLEALEDILVYLKTLEK